MGFAKAVPEGCGLEFIGLSRVLRCRRIRSAQADHDALRCWRVASVSAAPDGDQRVRFRKVCGGTAPRNIVRIHREAQHSTPLVAEVARDIYEVSRMKTEFVAIRAIQHEDSPSVLNATIAIVETIQRVVLDTEVVRPAGWS